jgi:SAM-dependent methyltransferase
MSVQQVEQAQAEACQQRLIGIVNDAAVALMLSVGHRTRLLDTMARVSPATSGDIARAAGLNERYVREWLGAMATAGIVEFDPAARHYHLPSAYRALLTRAASPNNMAVTAQWISVLGEAESAVVEAFRHGEGVPYSAYPRFHEVMAEESSQTTLAGLQEHILPLVDGLEDRLREGIDVLDVGCGAGRAVHMLAGLYPNSRFTGYDFSSDAIAGARVEATRLGLRNARFEVVDVAAMADAGMYDLVTAFDAIHDQRQPARVLANIVRALGRGGTLLMQDIAASSHLEQNMALPLGPLTYTISCMHCMSVALRDGGAGLGAAWGRELAERMLREAGFTSVRVEQLPHDIINYYYVATL